MIQTSATPSSLFETIPPLATWGFAFLTIITLMVFLIFAYQKYRSHCREMNVIRNLKHTARRELYEGVQELIHQGGGLKPLPEVLYCEPGSGDIGAGNLIERMVNEGNVGLFPPQVDRWSISTTRNAGRIAIIVERSDTQHRQSQEVSA